MPVKKEIMGRCRKKVTYSSKNIDYERGYQDAIFQNGNKVFLLGNLVEELSEKNNELKIENSKLKGKVVCVAAYKDICEENYRLKDENNTLNDLYQQTINQQKEKYQKGYNIGYFDAVKELPNYWSVCAKITPPDKVIIRDGKTYKEFLDILNKAYENQCEKRIIKNKFIPEKQVKDIEKQFKQAEDKYMQELGKKPIDKLSIDQINDYLNRAIKRLCH